MTEQQHPYQPQFVTAPKKRRRWLHLVGYPAVLLTGLLVGLAIGAAGSTADSPRAGTPERTVTITQPAPSATPAATTKYTSPAYSMPKAKDFRLTVVVREKQCFGSAGCNITYRVDAVWSPMFDPSVTYDVTYEVRGGEDGPVVNTMTVTGDKYQRDGEEMVSTSSKNTKLTAAATRVEAQ
jgi:hypothetical protein